MSADTQILITLREYCRALEQRETILLRDPPQDPQAYQQQLTRINTYTRSINRHQLVLRAWARREDPIMTALAQDRDEDVTSFSQRLEQWKERHKIAAGSMAAAQFSATALAQNTAAIKQFLNINPTPQYNAQVKQTYTQAYPQAQAQAQAQQTGKPTP